MQCNKRCADSHESIQKRRKEEKDQPNELRLVFVWRGMVAYSKEEAAIIKQE